MDRWSADLRRGKRLLARHRPAGALKRFRLAHTSCPDTNPGALAEILYYEGLSLKKLQMPGRAIRRWVESQRYVKRGHTRKTLSRATNAYGMPRQGSDELDDRMAFHSIHLLRYLKQKKSRRIDTEAEQDVITELIDEYWRAIVRVGALDGKSAAEKLTLFRTVPIVFPLLSVPNGVRDVDPGPVHVDFERRRRLSALDRCRCGTGLAFQLCCGRTPAPDELANGEF